MGRAVGVGDVLLDTICLGREPDAAGTQTAWSRLETAGLSGLVRQEGCALWLYRRLKDAGAENATQPSFRTWLAKHTRDLTARNLLVDVEVSRLAQWLSRHRFPHVWLKGVARRVGAARYPFADARATNDVDLLVPQDRARKIWEELQRTGYQTAGAFDRTPEHHFHLPPLLGADRVAVELHLATSKHESPAEAWRRATSTGVKIARDGLTYVIPSATELLWHSVTHGLIQGTAAFRLRYFQDASVILASGEPIDWELIARRLASPEVPSETLALTWLGAAARLAGHKLPAELPRAQPFDLSRAMRWRLSVHRRWAHSPRVAAKLIEEGTRAEVGWPITPGVPGTSPAVRLRRRLAAVAARAAYRAWRML
jgi:hypothetical protein